MFANCAANPKLGEALLAKNLSAEDVIEVASGNDLRVLEAVAAAA